ncbi:chemotaxis protein CheX [Thiospirochaeta perfilievii]|uniref:Chemotaxis protein CheX n=1 Tax=Thiospirochaeta perfilievii TaxID=252967 RepID=A0A5C1QJ64_9SPIO|nr:chemotaxis protein CheX [Thiospirochaeta perfilievii]QEN06212.1 chemotaxis protein CheX [Thiospirochaeta perfilievii]
MSKISEEALECFKKSISEIMNESGFHNATISLEERDIESSILITIGFTGRLHGYLMLQTDFESATNFVNILADYIGMEIDSSSFGDFHKSTFCEITNQISGRSTIHLSSIGLDSNITPPSIIVGSSIYSSVSDYDVSQTYYINDAFGTFKIFICINIT